MMWAPIIEYLNILTDITLHASTELWWKAQHNDLLLCGRDDHIADNNGGSLLNNEGEEIDWAVFYCISQDVDLEESKFKNISNISTSWESNIENTSNPVSTLRQSCSSLVTFAPCPRKRVFVASSAFVLKNYYSHLLYHYIYRPYYNTNIYICSPGLQTLQTQWSPSQIPWVTAKWLLFKHQCPFPSSSPDESADPNAAVGCLRKIRF